MTYTTSPISGGNLNPAVSATLALLGVHDWHRALGYSAAQVLGGIAGGFCFTSVFQRKVTLEPGPAFTEWYAMAAEAAYTAVLCFVFSSCTVSRRQDCRDDQGQFYALAIALVVVAAGYAIGDVSGACINPAVSLGIDISSLSFGMGVKWALAEFAGAALAALLFRFTRPGNVSEEEGGLEQNEPALLTKCMSELLGVFVVTFTAGMNFITHSPAPSWSTAAAVMCMFYSLGNVSGGHFNPAITLAVVLNGRGKCSAREGLAYAVVQLAAGLLAGWTYAQFHEEGPHSLETYSVGPAGDFSRRTSCIMELFFSFTLVYVFLACAPVNPLRSTGHGTYSVLAIGGCVAASGCLAGLMPGSYMNPAVGLGISSANFFHSGTQPLPPRSDYLVFAAAELLGGAFAAAAFQRTHPQSKDAVLMS